MMVLTAGLLAITGSLGAAQNANMSRRSGLSMMHRHRNDQNSNLNATDLRFMRQADEANRDEIDTGKWMMERISTATQMNQNQWNNLVPLRYFANRMIDDHTTAQTALSRLAQNLNVTLPNMLDENHRAQMDRLMRLHGAALFRSYISEQRQGHEKVIALFKRELRDGSNPDVKEYARRFLPVIEKHLELATNLSRNGFRAHRNGYDMNLRSNMSGMSRRGSMNQ
jgi:putative membrane protein